MLKPPEAWSVPASVVVPEVKETLPAPLMIVLRPEMFAGFDAEIARAIPSSH